jgi:hypothetical protein
MKKLIVFFLAFSMAVPIFALSTSTGIDDRDDAWWNQNSSFKTSDTLFDVRTPKKAIPAQINIDKPEERQGRYDDFITVYGICVAFMGILCLTNEGGTPRFVRNFTLINAIAGGGYLYYKFGYSKGRK